MAASSSAIITLLETLDVTAIRAIGYIPCMKDPWLFDPMVGDPSP